MINWIKRKFQAYGDKRFLKRLNRVLKSNGISADLLVKGDIHSTGSVICYDSSLKDNLLFTPTDGDFLVLKREDNPYKNIYIYKATDGEYHTCYATSCGNVILNELRHGTIHNYVSKDIQPRYAFKTEKETFLESLRASGYDWDGEQIVKLKGE
jgi:hypothetical protein